jgi:hypothetical protein
MTRNRNPYTSDIREINAGARSAGWRAAVWVLAIVLFVGAISVGIWWFQVSTSDVKGAGDATRQQNSAANRLQAQAKYAQLYQGILAADRNIDTLAAAAATDPTQVNKTNLVGAQNVCQQAVADYNAMAVNALTAQWRPVELPARVGDDPSTDCKPATATPTP